MQDLNPLQTRVEGSSVAMGGPYFFSSSRIGMFEEVQKGVSERKRGSDGYLVF